MHVRQGRPPRSRAPGPGLPVRPDHDHPHRPAIAALAGDGTDNSPYGSTIHPLSSALSAIHTVAPDAQVYIAGYPRVLQPPASDDCAVGAVTEGAATTIPLEITAADARAVDDAIVSLNSTIQLAARSAGTWATYVDPTTTFAGHGRCTPAPWINPIEAAVRFDSGGRLISVTPYSGSAHPTAQGQRDGYAAAFGEAGIGARLAALAPPGQARRLTR